MTGLRDAENVIKAPQQLAVLHRGLMFEHAKALFRQRQLGNAVMTVQGSLGTPAYMKGRKAVMPAPVQDIRKLRPVMDLFKGQILNRCASDDQTVKLLMLNLGKRHIKPVQVSCRGIAVLVGVQTHKDHLRLKRGIPQHSQQLGFCRFFGGHQVKNRNP